MIWWNAGRLARDLRAGRVTARDELGYLLATLVLETVTGRPSLLAAFGAGGEGARGAFWPLLILAISAAGTLACFRANARGDGRAFLQRVVCLGLPVFVRVYAGYAAVSVVLYVVLGAGPSRRDTVGSWLVWGTLYLGTLVATFVVLRRYVSIAAGATLDPPPA